MLWEKGEGGERAKRNRVRVLEERAVKQKEQQLAGLSKVIKTGLIRKVKFEQTFERCESASKYISVGRELQAEWLLAWPVHEGLCGCSEARGGESRRQDQRGDRHHSRRLTPFNFQEN